MAVVLGIPIVYLGIPSQGVRFLVTVVGWIAFGGLMLLAGRAWARSRGIPFVPAVERRNQRLAWEKTQPFPAYLLRYVRGGFLAGMGVTQVMTGHPFWHNTAVEWTPVFCCMMGLVTAAVIMRFVPRSPAAARSDPAN